MAIDNFGIAFARKVRRRTWQTGVFPAVTNSDYEGQVKEFGDRLRLLMFLAAGGALGDYSAGSDMDLETIFDDEATLVIEKRKYWNFPIDRLEQSETFAYASDIPDALVEVKQRRLAEEIDQYVLALAGDAKAGNWVGYDMRVTSTGTDTEASVATTATGGTLSVRGTLLDPAMGAQIELGDGTAALAGFTAADVGKPVRLLSGTTWASEWYRISAFTDTNTVSIVNYDGATQGSEIPNGDILRGLGGAREFTGGADNTDGKPTTERGWGWELQAAFATTIASGTIYEQVTELDRRLNENEVPSDDRHIVGPPSFMMTLKQASEIIPAIQMAYTDVVLNGNVGKIGGFMLHEAAGIRVSTRLAHSTCATADGVCLGLTDGGRTYSIPAWHRSYCTFAYKWAESRVVEAEDRFARKYQGLHLYGAVVPEVSRRAGAVLFGAL